MPAGKPLLPTPEITARPPAQLASPQSSSSLPSCMAPLQRLSGGTRQTSHSPPLQMELLLFFCAHGRGRTVCSAEPRLPTLKPRCKTSPRAAAPTYRSRSAACPAACSRRSVVAAARPLWTWPRSAGPHRCGTASQHWPAHTKQSPREIQLFPKSTVTPGGAQRLRHPGTSLPSSADPMCTQGREQEPARALVSLLS